MVPPRSVGSASWDVSVDTVAVRSIKLMLCRVSAVEQMLQVLIRRELQRLKIDALTSCLQHLQLATRRSSCMKGQKCPAPSDKRFAPVSKPLLLFVAYAYRSMVVNWNFAVSMVTCAVCEPASFTAGGLMPLGSSLNIVVIWIEPFSSSIIVMTVA